MKTERNGVNPDPYPNLDRPLSRPLSGAILVTTPEGVPWRTRPTAIPHESGTTVQLDLELKRARLRAD